jgi:hypothetical protein
MPGERMLPARPKFAAKAPPFTGMSTTLNEVPPLNGKRT